MQLDDLTADLLDATIRRALRHGGDFAEVYVEDRRSLGLSLEDRRVERAAGGRESGFGVRLTSGDRTYYSYSDDVSEADLQRAAELRLLDLPEVIIRLQSTNFRASPEVIRALLEQNAGRKK